MSGSLNPLDYGVLPSGFSRMRMPEIRQSIIDALTQSLGIVLETRPDSITGQFIDVFAEREATLWELAEAVYFAMYPISATGINLDYSVSFAGVTRLFAEQSTAPCICYGAENTTVPAGSFVRNNISQNSFTLNTDVTITRQRAIDVTLKVLTAIVDFQYWLQIDGVIYSYICAAGNTTIDIANSLYTQLLPSRFILVLNVDEIRIYSIESLPFDLQMSSDIQITILGSQVGCTAEEYGLIDVTANTINSIVSTLTGWDSIINLVDGKIGRNLETDDELRLRYDRGVFQLGAATLNSLQANLVQNIPGLITCQVYENQEDVTDADGRPPHSIEAVVSGGDPQVIATEIWLLKAAGIDTYGSTTVQVVDSIGVSHPIHFNRPEPIYIWVNCDIELYSEESFLDNGIGQIQNIIVNTGNSFGIGKDVILQRFYGPIYSGVSGVGHITITLAQSTDPNTPPAPGAFVSSNIPISAREISTFILNNVKVLIKT